jgi:hypothetical protein
MPPKNTDKDKIGELERLADTLVERIDAVRREKADNTAVAVLEERVNRLKQDVEEGRSRSWSLVQLLVGGLIGGGFTLLVQLLLQHLKK